MIKWFSYKEQSSSEEELFPLEEEEAEEEEEDDFVQKKNSTLFWKKKQMTGQQTGGAGPEATGGRGGARRAGEIDREIFGIQASFELPFASHGAPLKLCGMPLGSFCHCLLAAAVLSRGCQKTKLNLIPGGAPPDPPNKSAWRPPKCWNCIGNPI
jgi:hypothetical protein